MDPQAQELLDFWLRELTPDDWYRSDEALDARIRDRWRPLWDTARAGGLREWTVSRQSCLALVIVLDQFPRNMFRGSARTYAADPLALTVAGRALARGDDRTVDPALRTFFYLPFMHSEALADQEQCVALYRALGDAESLRYAEDHADIVRRFGRFPHRNDVLGRATTPEEQAFLDAGGFAG